MEHQLKISAASILLSQPCFFWLESKQQKFKLTQYPRIPLLSAITVIISVNRINDELVQKWNANLNIGNICNYS